MDEKEIFVLPDRNVTPDEGLVFKLIGEKKKQWTEIMNYLGDNYKGSSGEWRYYNDGKQWLFKMQFRKKTLFWIALPEGTFRITFYFGNKAEPVILSSDLPEAVKENFITAKRYGTIRAITFRIEEVSDMRLIFMLIDLKTKLK